MKAQLKILPSTDLNFVAAEQIGPKKFRHYIVSVPTILGGQYDLKEAIQKHIERTEGREVEFLQDESDGRNDGGFNVENVDHLISAKAKTILGKPAGAMMLQREEGRVLEMQLVNKINLALYPFTRTLANLLVMFGSFIDPIKAGENEELDYLENPGLFTLMGKSDEELNKRRKYPNFTKILTSVIHFLNYLPHRIERYAYNKLIIRRIYPAFFLATMTEDDPMQIAEAIVKLEKEIIRLSPKIKSHLVKMAVVRLANTTGAGSPHVVFSIPHFDIGDLENVPPSHYYDVMRERISPFVTEEGLAQPAGKKRPYSDVEIERVVIKDIHRMGLSFRMKLKEEANGGYFDPDPKIVSIK